MALESRRLDKLEEVVGRSADVSQTLRYALRACQKLIVSRSFRNEVRWKRREMGVEEGW